MRSHLHPRAPQDSQRCSSYLSWPHLTATTEDGREASIPELKQSGINYDLSPWPPPLHPRKETFRKLSHPQAQNSKIVSVSAAAEHAAAFSTVVCDAPLRVLRACDVRLHCLRGWDGKLSKCFPLDYACDCLFLSILSAFLITCVRYMLLFN